MGEVTVGLDIGTTSVKALAVADDGSVVASVRRPHRVMVGPARLEHDADAAWRQGVGEAFAEVVIGQAVRGVAVAAMVPSLSAVDERGRPCGAGLLYGDGRGAAAPGKNPAESGEAAGFLRWLGAQHPRASGFWPAQAVANHALCGRAAIDYATAYCLAPLFDGNGWVGESPDQFPAVVADVAEPVGRVGSSGPLVGAGTIDALAAQYVVGADSPGDVLVLLGATLIVWQVTSGWVERPGLWSVPHTASGLGMVGGASNAGGLFVDWVGRLLVEEQTTLDPHDVPVWQPYARGERTPLHRPDLRAGLEGLHLGHGPAAVERAAYEASGFVVRQILDLARGPGVEPPRRIVAAGGGVRRAGWVAALADCTGLPVDVAAVPDATALGTAFLARCVAGLESNPNDGRRWARTAKRIEPDPAWQAPCTDRYETFRAGTAALVEGTPEP
ncbi:MAG TPA: FGGY-family carbohydrate kinase [Acidimicrobiales bacterium]|jgi:xylulokinase